MRGCEKRGGKVMSLWRVPDGVKITVQTYTETLFSYMTKLYNFGHENRFLDDMAGFLIRYYSD